MKAMSTDKNICRDLRLAGYMGNNVLIELHRTGAKYYISLENCATGAFEISQGYFSLDQAHTVYSVLLERLGHGYDFAALAELMNS
jgi:hypothetical protein